MLGPACQKWEVGTGLRGWQPVDLGVSVPTPTFLVLAAEKLVGARLPQTDNSHAPSTDQGEAALSFL